MASIAPQSLEDTLLAFADNPEFQEFAPLALHNLNTPHSIRELANSLPKFDYSERIASVGYLADTGDAQWFPLLQRLAQANPGLRDYVDSAAQLGGDKILPTLIEWMQSPDVKFTRINAVTAMGYTGSRAAVPILIDLLRSSNPDISGRAQFALRLLTHHAACGSLADHPELEYSKWSRWWTSEGRSAPIYKPTECGDVTPLPLRVVTG